MNILSNGEAKYSRFEVKVFTFVDESTTYIHCNLAVCSASLDNCKPVNTTFQLTAIGLYRLPSRGIHISVLYNLTIVYSHISPTIAAGCLLSRAVYA